MCHPNPRIRHDATRTVDAINRHLKESGWFRDFPPEGGTCVMMGIGQVVALRFPAEKLRDVDRLIEGEAWGGYRMEVYPTSDDRGLNERLKEKMG